MVARCSCCSSKVLLVRCAAATHASGALDDLSHGDRVECGCATGVLLDVLCGSASGVLRLKDDGAPALIPVLDPDPVAGDETGCTIREPGKGPRILKRRVRSDQK